MLLYWLQHMVVVAQLVRAPGCGPGGRRFKSGLPPHFTARGRAVAARQAHNLKVNGSIPFPATIERLCRSCDRLFVCYLFVLFLRLSFSENGPSLFLNHPIQFLNQLKITKNHYQIHIDACIFHKVQYFSSIVVR